MRLRSIAQANSCGVASSRYPYPRPTSTNPYRRIAVRAKPLPISTEDDIRQSNSLMAYYANCCFSKEVAMPTRNVVLTDYQAELVEQLVASGRYQNASEVLRDGLRLVETREAEDKARLRTRRRTYGRSWIRQPRILARYRHARTPKPCRPHWKHLSKARTSWAQKGGPKLAGGFCPSMWRAMGEKVATS